MWMVLLVGEAQGISSDETMELALNVYEISSTREIIRFLYAALGFPTKSTLLTTAHKGNLITSWTDG